MFEFELRPVEPSFLQLTTEVEFTSAANDHFYATITEGTAVVEDPIPTEDLPDPTPNLPTNEDKTGGDNQ
jgi:hypothetical protein